MAHWLTDHTLVAAILVAVSLTASLAGFLAVRYLVYAPPEFFARNFDPNARFRQRHPVLRWAMFVVRNTIGMLLLLAGITMLVTPGPGVLSIFVAILLLDLPGKHGLLVKLARSRGVLRTLNMLRAKAGQPLVEFPSSRPIPPRNLVA